MPPQWYSLFPALIALCHSALQTGRTVSDPRRRFFGVCVAVVSVAGRGCASRMPVHLDRRPSQHVSGDCGCDGYPAGPAPRIWAPILIRPSADQPSLDC